MRVRWSCALSWEASWDPDRLAAWTALERWGIIPIESGKHNRAGKGRENDAPPIPSRHRRQGLVQLELAAVAGHEARRHPVRGGQRQAAPARLESANRGAFARRQG